MSQLFEETAYWTQDEKLYRQEHERIFGKRHKVCGWCQDTGIEPENNQPCRRGCETKEVSDGSLVQREDAIDRGLRVQQEGGTMAPHEQHQEREEG